MTRLILLFLTLQLVTCGCHRLINRLEVVRLECGELDRFQPSDFTFIKGTAPGAIPVFRDQVEAEASLRVVSFTLRKADLQVTTKGCLAIPTKSIKQIKFPFRLVNVTSKLAADIDNLDHSSVNRLEFSPDLYRDSFVEFQCSAFISTASNAAESLAKNIEMQGLGLFKVSSVVLNNPKSEIRFMNYSLDGKNLALRPVTTPVADEVYSIAVEYTDGQGQTQTRKIDNCQVEIDSKEPSFILATDEGQVSLEKPFVVAAGKKIEIKTSSSEYELSLCTSLLLPCRQIKDSIFTFDDEGEFTLKGNYFKKNGLEGTFRLSINVDKTPPTLGAKFSVNNSSILSGLISRPIDGSIDLDLSMSDNLSSPKVLLNSLECAFSVVDGIGGKIQSDIRTVQVGSNPDSMITLNVNQFKSCSTAFAINGSMLRAKLVTPTREWYGKAIKLSFKVRDSAGLITASSIVSTIDAESFFTHKNQTQKGISVDTGILVLNSGLLITLDAQKRSILSSSNAGEEWTEHLKLDRGNFKLLTALDGLIIATTQDGHFYQVSDLGATAIDELTGYESAIAIGEAVYLATKADKIFKLEASQIKEIGPAPERVFANKCSIFGTHRLFCGQLGEVEEIDLSQVSPKWTTSDKWGIFASPNGLVSVGINSIEIETPSGRKTSVPAPTLYLTIRDAFIDNQQRLWLISDSKGLEVFDGKAWNSMSSQTSLPMDSPFSGLIKTGTNLTGIFDRKILFNFIDHSSFSEVFFDSPNAESCERLSTNAAALAVSCIGADASRRVLLLDNTGLKTTDILSASDPAALFPGDKNHGFIVGTDDGFMQINEDMSLTPVPSLGKYSARSKFGRLTDDSVVVTDSSLISVFNGFRTLTVFTTSKIAEFIRNVIDLNGMPQTLNINATPELEDQDSLTKPFTSAAGETFVGGRGGFFTVKPGEISFTKRGDETDQIVGLLLNGQILTQSAIKSRSNNSILSFDGEAIGGLARSKSAIILTNSFDGLSMLVTDTAGNLQRRQALGLTTDESPEVTHADGKMWLVGKNRILLF